MTILGYDIGGQPLRAGDRVVVTGSAKWGHGQVLTLVGPEPDQSKFPGQVELLRDGADYPDRCAYPHNLRKLPPKQADNETTTWESIERLTGWVPEGVRV